ncbi:MAG: hypothetical protein LBF85_01640, partial [Tannerella sp.]|nr:hypothetical protein [Tannerella sp.]
MTYAEILRNRNLQIPTKPLWKMEITAEEYEGMRETLRNACNANRLACYGKTLVYQWIKKWGETVD